ncbi:MAG: hypothetical protein ACXADW_23165 [Candidatus Hodarchaeales archaeon]|jgi:hypothetical protein
MTASEVILILDLISTVGLELWADLKEEGEEMTMEEFVEVSAKLKERRKLSIAAIKAH